MQLSLFPPEIDWQPPDTFPELTGEVALDLETKDPDLMTLGPGWAFPAHRGGHIAGVSVAWGDNECGYWPIGHGGGGNLDKTQVLNWLSAQLKKPDVTVVMANSSYDYGWSKFNFNAEFANDPHDVQLAAPLIDEHRTSYSLDALSKDYLKDRKANRGLDLALKDHGLRGKGDLWKLPAPFVGPYAEQDALLTLRLWRVQKEILTAQDLWTAYEVEREIMPLLVEARQRGVRVNVSAAEALAKGMQDREREALEALKRLTGVAVDPWANDAIARVLRARGVPLGTTATGRDSISKGVLRGSKDEAVRLISVARAWSKARGTFVEGHVLRHAVEGRIHCAFHQLRRTDDEGGGYGTVSQRFSSSEPNLQQLPSVERAQAEEDPDFRAVLVSIASEVRSLFLPEPDTEWASIDYSSQEPRLMCHYAEKANCTGGFAAAQRYRDNPRLKFYDPIAKAANVAYSEAKIIVLAQAYGQGEGALCERLGYPTEPASFEKNGRTINYKKAGEAGKKVLSAVDEGAPFVKELQKLCREASQRRGYVTGLDGARFRIKEERDLSKTLNKLIQGSAARQMKRSMAVLRRSGLGHLFNVTVHDELGINKNSEGDLRRVVDIMENSTSLVVPTVCDVAVGDSWGTAK